LSKGKTNLDLAELMMEVVPKAMQVIRQEMRHERGDKLTVTQFRMLTNVRKGVTGNKELGDRLGVSEAAVSRMIEVLVKENFIKREVSESDRRHKVLSLTAEGTKLHEKIRSSARERLKIKLEALSAEDKKTAAAGLEVLLNNLSIFG
jgi:MarR family transcriptional regulator for hemolysin